MLLVTLNQVASGASLDGCLETAMGWRCLQKCRVANMTQKSVNIEQEANPAGAGNGWILDLLADFSEEGS